MSQERLDAAPGPGRTVRDPRAGLPAIAVDPDVVEGRRECRAFSHDRGRRLRGRIVTAAARGRQQNRTQQERESDHGAPPTCGKCGELAYHRGGARVLEEKMNSW